MSLEKLLTAINEGDYVQAKDAFYQEVNERVSLKIDEKRTAILEGKDESEEDDESDDDDDDDSDDDDDDSIKESLSNMSETELNKFISTLSEHEYSVLAHIVEGDEYLEEGFKSAVKKAGGLVKRTVKGTAKDVARNLGRGAAVAAGAAGGMAVGGVPGAVAGGVAGNVAYQAAKDKIKSKLAARKK